MSLLSVDESLSVGLSSCRMPFPVDGLQNATTSSEERTSAEAEGGRLPHREVTAERHRALLKGAKQSISVLEQIFGRKGATELSDWPSLLT